jgi:rod shape-determining protein MreB
MIIDIGGGTTEVAVLSLGGIVVSNSIRTAGDKIDAAIVSYIRYRHNILIGESTAEVLKKNIGSVHPDADVGAMDIRGRNLLNNGLPATISISSGELREAMGEQIADIVECIRATLEKTPPELSSDIYDNGIILSGGGAMLRGLDRLVSQITGIRVSIAKKPLDSVVLGIGKMIESISQYENFVDYRSK